MKHRFLQALARQPVDCVPVWMMRQAGRYLPQYRAVRAREPDFLNFCHHVDWVTEVTLQPLDQFDFDAAILFSDILVLPKAMGVSLSIEPGVGPVLYDPVLDLKKIDALSCDITEKTAHVMQAVSAVQKELSGRVPLIGFAGSPFTVATYCLDGHSRHGFLQTKTMLYKQPDLLHRLLDKLTTATISYLCAQVEAGVDVIQLFDSWGGVLTTSAYQEFSLAYMQKIVAATKHYAQQQGRKLPVILFTKGGGQWLSPMAGTGADCLGLDWMTDLGAARQTVGDRVALQGNLDPSVLLTNPEAVAIQTKQVLEAHGEHAGHVFNLGHGIHKDTPIECVQAMLETIKNYRY